MEVKAARVNLLTLIAEPTKSPTQWANKKGPKKGPFLQRFQL